VESAPAIGLLNTAELALDGVWMRRDEARRVAHLRYSRSRLRLAWQIKQDQLVLGDVSWMLQRGWTGNV
jgi:hypothetical protein